MTLTVDTRRAFRTPDELAGLVKAVAEAPAGTDETNWVEFKTGLDLEKPHGKFTAARAILAFANRSPKVAAHACEGVVTAAHLTALGEGERLASLTLLVTVLDQRQAGFAAAAVDEDTAKVGIALSARKGYLDGRSLAEAFAWLRPTGLVWRCWINNYVEGKSPQPFDVLFWTADTVRMTAALHRDMVLMGLHNSLAKPGAVSMLGTPRR
jgi:poly(3-hydroxyalkanoate) synthetase